MYKNATTNIFNNNNYDNKHISNTETYNTQNTTTNSHTQNNTFFKNKQKTTITTTGIKRKTKTRHILLIMDKKSIKHTHKNKETTNISNT